MGSPVRNDGRSFWNHHLFMTLRSPSILLPFLACATGVAIFSGMDAAMKGLSLGMGVYNALLWRSLAGSLIGAVLMLALRLPWPTSAALRLHLLRGLVVSGMAPLFFIGLIKLPLAEAIALSFIAPLIALYLAALLLKERIGRSAIFASVLGLAGVAVILSGRVRGSYDAEAVTGAAAVLGSAMLFAWNLILQRQQAQISSPVEVAFFQNVVLLGVFALVAMSGIRELQPVVPAKHDWPLILLTAGLAFTSLALLSWAYARAEAQRLIPVEYSAFVWAAIMGWIVFAEHLTLTTLTGTALIVAGCLIGTRRNRETPPHSEGAAV